MCLFLLFFILLTLFCRVCLANWAKICNFALVIELEKHIEVLLLDNDCVIVPGLGGFMAHHVDARFDKDSNMFLPPLRTLGFNPKLDMNDSLLAQSYVEAYDISYPEALKKIDSEVAELKRTLEIEGRYELDNIGVIVINDEGNYEFEPCEAGVLTPELYGLAEVEIQSLRNEAVADDVASFVALPTAGVTCMSSSLGSECGVKGVNAGAFSTVGAMEEKANSDDRVISVKVSVLRNIVAVACAVVAFFMLATPISNDAYGDGKKMGNIGNGLLYNLIPKDGGVQNVQLSGSEDANLKNGYSVVKSQNARWSTERKDAQLESKSETSGVSVKPVTTNARDLKKNNDLQDGRDKNIYCIVLACRITKSNAEAFVERLHAEGYSKAHIEGEAGNSLKVVYGSYSSEENALSELKSFRNKDVFKDAWIYYVK